MTHPPLIAPNTEPASSDDRHQPVGAFIPGIVGSGYHVDLRGKAGSYGTPAEAEAWLELLMSRRERVLPVTVLQLGIGAWQRGIDEDDPEREAWASIGQAVASWAAVDMDGRGRFVHHQPMPHTYAIPAGWYSAMAQGLGVSLLVRHDMLEDADRCVRSMLEPEDGLLTETEAGPILEEYPAEPRPHVLNGWIWAMLGLYDRSIAEGGSEDVRERTAAEFERHVDSLVAQLHEYETGRGWSTYDRYPHPVANVASPFYQRLHVCLLDAVARVAPRTELTETSARWAGALERPTTRAAAVARKVGFRIVKPRRKAA